MENIVILYKVPWTASSLNQPYFMSDTARDNYLNTLQHKTVLQNVNINFKTRLSLELKVAIDISEAETYNYAKIVYNNKNYFACIMDYEQISVNKTRLYLERHALAEQSNFLDLFQQFQISKCTLANYKYGKSANIKVPEFRVQKTLLKPSENLHDGDFEEYLIYYTASGSVKKLTVHPHNFFIAFLDASIFKSSIADSVISVFGEKTQYVVCFFNDDGNLILNCKLHTESPVPSDTDGTCNFYPTSRATLDRLSPYIKSLFFTSIPIGEDNNGNQYFPYKLSQMTYGIEGSAAVFRTVAFCSDSDDYYSVEIPVSKSELFTSIEARIYSLSNKFEINCYEFITESGTIYINFKYIFSINGSEILGEVIGQSDSVYTNNAKRFQFELGDSTTYLIDQASNFDAQNRYYDALTRNATNKMSKLGGIQAATQIATGVIQGATGIGMAAMRGGGGGLGMAAEGAGNIIRGIGSIAETEAKITAYQNERALTMKQEKAKPDEVQTGGSSAINIYSQHGLVHLVKETPFDEDVLYFNSQIRFYGIDAYLIRDYIDFTEFSYENNFYLKANAIIKNDVFVDKPIYDDLYNLLSNGCRYFIVNNT